MPEGREAEAVSFRHRTEKLTKQRMRDVAERIPYFVH